MNYMKKNKTTTFPWEHPKLQEEDPQSLKLIQKIMTSPTYAMAEEDKAFLDSYEARGIRLELDYLKAELKMKKYGIEHTIVVFGSARIVEKETAMKRLSTVQKMLKKNQTIEKFSMSFMLQNGWLEKVSTMMMPENLVNL